MKVLINERAYQKIRNWVTLASGEVSGLGLVSEQKDEKGNIKQLIVNDVFLLKQECSGTETLLDDASVGQFLIELVQQNIDTSKVKLWWHSHADMNVFWSQTDEQCVLGLANSSYMISIVTNKKKDILTRIDVYQPFHITLNKVETAIQHPDDLELLEFCKKEFMAKVIEHSFMRMIPEPNSRTPGILEPSDRFDTEVERLENLVASGRISVDEYEERVNELMFREEMFEV